MKSCKLSRSQQTLITSEFGEGVDSTGDFLDMSGVRHWTGDLVHTEIKSK